MSSLEAAGRRLVMMLDVPPDEPEPAPTSLEELAAQTRYKLNAAIAIRRQASAVHGRASVRESQYREQLTALQEAQRLVEHSVTSPEQHAEQVAELESLAADVALELTSEDEFDDSGDVIDEDEDDQQGDDDQVDADESE